MGSLYDLRTRLQSLQDTIIDLVGESMQKNAEIAADLNAIQLSHGLKTNGKESDFVYSPTTVEIKKEMSGLASVTDHLTNYDTGESYRRLYMAVNGRNVTFGTGSDKEDAISGRMDGLAFGLTEESQEELLKLHVLPDFISLVENHLTDV